MAAGGERAKRAVHDHAIGARLIGVRALGLEFGDVVARAERLAPGAAQDNAAHRVVGVERAQRLAQAPPKRLGHRVELVRPVKHQRDDAILALRQQLVGHCDISTPIIAILDA